MPCYVQTLKRNSLREASRASLQRDSFSRESVGRESASVPRSSRDMSRYSDDRRSGQSLSPFRMSHNSTSGPASGGGSYTPSEYLAKQINEKVCASVTVTSCVCG